MSETPRIIRWGVLGTARIAAKVGRAIREADGAELTAVASRSPQRAAEWARDHQAVRHCESYEALLDDAELEAVYIPLPNALHREWAIRAAEAGKDVLCEKPLGVTEAEAKEIAAACRENNVQLMDGTMWLHHPRTAAMHQHLRDGTLGELKRFTSAFSFCWKEVPDDDIRLQGDLGGGSLLDLGWYTIGAALWAFEELPQHVYGVARPYRDVDMAFSAILFFSGGRAASFDCAFDIELRKWFEVAGTEGSLICDDFTIPWTPEKARFWLHDGQGKAAEHNPPAAVQEVQMIENFCRLVRTDEPDPSWAEKSIATQRVCDALAASARQGQAVELS